MLKDGDVVLVFNSNSFLSHDTGHKKGGFVYGWIEIGKLD